MFGCAFDMPTVCVGEPVAPMRDESLVRAMSDSAAEHITKVESRRGDLRVRARSVSPEPPAPKRPRTLPVNELRVQSGRAATRSSGIPFETFVAARLREMATRQTGDGSVAASLLGKQVHAPWADVPARLLVEMGWESRDESERRRIYEGPRERRGFREYGADWVAEGELDGRRHLIVGQDKDHAVLSAGVLGRFFLVADYVRALNDEQGIPSDATSSLLCYPQESRISRRDGVWLDRKGVRCGMHRMAFTGFAPRAGRDPSELDHVDEDEPLMALEPHAVVEATLAALPAFPAAAYAAALPEGGRERAFQTKTVRSIVATPALHLVRAPPGCGKSAIAAAVLGSLVVPEHATRAGKGRAGSVIAFITAPLIDHVSQLLSKMDNVLLKLGSNYQSLVQRVMDDEVPSEQALLVRLGEGVRVFASTDKSAHLLLVVAREAKRRGSRLLVIKDEAHYNSCHSSPSSQLLSLVDASAGDVGIACTATPDGDVMDLPGLQQTLCMSLDEAIELGYCRPYQVVLPRITGADDDLPVEARTIAASHSIGLAALFLVGGMLHDGKRRAIAVVRNVKEARAAARLLRDACAFHGVECCCDVIVQHTLDRAARYREFQTGPTSEPAELNEEKGVRITLRFLVSVRILDMCVDLPECDAVGLLSPPTKHAEVESAHRAIQQFGRAMRGGRGVAFVYIFTDLKNPWLACCFAVLAEFDPGCRRRLSVRSTSVISMHSESATRLDASELQDVLDRYNVGGEPVRMPTVDEKVGFLVALCKAARPTQGKKVDIPSQHLPDDVKTYQFDAGLFWYHIQPNFEGKAAPTKLTKEQIDLLRRELPWIEAVITQLVAKRPAWAPTVDEKVQLLVALCKAGRPTQGKNIDVPSHHLPDDVKTYQFDAGQFWHNIQPNFVSSEKPPTKLTKDQIDLLLRELPWIEADIARLVAKRQVWAPDKDKKVCLLYTSDAADE